MQIKPELHISPPTVFLCSCKKTPVKSTEGLLRKMENRPILANSLNCARFQMLKNIGKTLKKVDTMLHSVDTNDLIFAAFAFFYTKQKLLVLHVQIRN